MVLLVVNAPPTLCALIDQYGDTDWRAGTVRTLQEHIAGSVESDAGS